MGSLKQKMMKNKNYKVKQPWSPATDRGKVNKSSIDYKLKWPHLDSSRQAQKLIQSKRVVKKDRPPETLKYRPNGCDQWFAHVGTPPPSVRLTSRTWMKLCLNDVRHANAIGLEGEYDLRWQSILGVRKLHRVDCVRERV